MRHPSSGAAARDAETTARLGPVWGPGGGWWGWRETPKRQGLAPQIQCLWGVEESKASIPSHELALISS